VSQSELLVRVIGALQKAGLAYMITGGLASSMQGEPRTTHDLDLVIDLPESGVHALLAAFPPPDYCLDEDSVREAVANKSTFNLIETKDGDKVDFWLLTEEPFDRSRFARRRREVFMGMEMAVSSPEDTILAKLRWAVLSGGSEKHFHDALRIYEVQYACLDFDYLERWVAELGVAGLWRRLKKEAEVLS